MKFENDLVLRAARGEDIERYPVWLMRQAGRILPEYRAVRGKLSGFKELVETLSSFLDFKYEFDISKSSGWPKRLMDISLAREMIGYNPNTSLEDGLKETWNWFLNNQDEHKLKKNYFKE